MKLYVGVPTRGKPHLQAHYSLVRAVEKSRISADIIFEPGWHVVTARNSVVRSFLKSDASHLAMVDDDVIVPEDGLRKLCVRAMAGAKAVVGVAPQMSRGVLLSNVMLEDDGAFAPLWPHGFRRVKQCGLAIGVFARECFERVEFPWFNWLESRDGREIGEDIHFTERLRAGGIEIWADCSVRCGHFKEVDLAAFAQRVSPKVALPLLVVAAPRSGTKWCAEVLRRAGVQVGHERRERDGMVSCWAAALRAKTVPNWAEDQPPMYVYDVASIVHLVRDPIACIDSLVRMTTRFEASNWREWSQRYIGSFADDDPVIECARYWLAWQRLCISTAPLVRVRLEDGPGPIVEAARRCGFDARPVEDPGPLNTLPDADRDATRDHLASAAPMLLDEIDMLARCWGYAPEIGGIRAGKEADV